MNAISKSDRVLIDAALAAGRVTVIPPGTSAYDYPVWTGTALRYPEGDTRRRTLGAAAFLPAKPVAPKVHGVLRRSQDRRRRMIEMISAGHLDADIAADLGVTLKWLRQMAAGAGVVLRSATPPKKPGHKAGTARAQGALSKRVAGLIAAGRSVAEIVAETATTRKIVLYHLDRLGHKDVVAAEAAAAESVMLQRARDWLAQREAGKAVRDIAAAEGLGRSTVHHWIQRARLGPGPRPNVAATAQRVAHQAERRAEVARMFAAGLPYKVIAQAFGMSMTTLQADLKALGLTGTRPRLDGPRHAAQVRADRLRRESAERGLVWLARMACGQTARAIAAAAGITESTVNRNIARARQDCPDQVAALLAAERIAA